MARTPLLRAIQRLAEEHRTADRLGIPPDELRGRRSEAAYTRGDFLKRAGVAGAAVAVAGPAAFARPSGSSWRSQQRIAIVGGGIAGLSAALTLADAGVASTVYEANTAGIGGRMHSDRSGYWSNHQVSEFCGELIDTGHETILALADRFGLTASDLLAAQPKGTDDTYYFLGDFYPTSQADKDFRPREQGAAEALRRRRLSDDVGQQHADRADARPHVGVRLDRDVRPRRPPLAVRAAARRRVRGGVRREHDRPGEPQPRLPARVPARPGRLVDLRRVGRALPHRRRQPAAARGDRGVAPVRNREAGLDDAGDPHESRRLRLDAVRDAGPHADGHRRPGDPLHELRRAAHARLLGRGLRPAQADGDHAARRRP